MTTKELKTELHNIIDQTDDESILKAVRTLLTVKQQDEQWREKLTARAKKSEADIKEGRVNDLSEVRERTDKQLDT